MSRKIIIPIVAAAGLVVAGVTSLIIGGAALLAAEQRTIDTLNPFVQPFLDAGHFDAVESDPHIRGKIAIVEVEERCVDTFFYQQTPEHIRPLEPDEIGTIALIEWEYENVGYYVDDETRQRGGDAFRCIGHLTLIDVASRVIIEHREFEGDMPPQGTRVDGDRRGRRPDWDVLAYIKKLPVR